RSEQDLAGAARLRVRASARCPGFEAELDRVPARDDTHARAQLEPERVADRPAAREARLHHRVAHPDAVIATRDDSLDRVRLDARLDEQVAEARRRGRGCVDREHTAVVDRDLRASLTSAHLELAARSDALEQGQ